MLLSTCLYMSKKFTGLSKSIFHVTFNLKAPFSLKHFGIMVMVMDYLWLCSCQLFEIQRSALGTQPNLFLAELFGTELPFYCHVDVHHPALGETTNSLALSAITTVRMLIRAFP